MFREITKDTGREGSGWNEYGKMTKKGVGGIKHDSKRLGRTITWLGLVLIRAVWPALLLNPILNYLCCVPAPRKKLRV